MKNQLKFLATLLVFAVIFSTCKDNEDRVSPLIGTWALSSKASTECDNPDVNGTYPCDPTSFSATCDTLVITQTTITSTSSFFDTEKYTINGNQLTIFVQILSAYLPFTYTFVISASTLTITEDGENCKFVSIYSKI